MVPEAVAAGNQAAVLEVNNNCKIAQALWSAPASKPNNKREPLLLKERLSFITEKIAIKITSRIV